jgi:glycosyltransferase involved in cell wall biosynthesis/GNAT superfamily N-acetyltransferase
VKVAWFTPFSPKSAIGDFGDRVTRRLAEHADVEIWVPDLEEVRESALPVRRFAHDPSLLSRLAGIDHIVYNLGDNLGYHGAIYDVSREFPGIVILNDRIYQHFFAAGWLEGNRASRYVERMEALYGDAGLSAAQSSLAARRVPVWEHDDDTMRFPLFEDILAGARGAIVHAQSHADVVRSRWLGPVRVFAYPTAPPPRGDGQRVEWPVDPSRTLVATVGYVNRNKQVHRVVEALGRDRSLAQRVQYVVVGPYDPNGAYAASLFETIERLGLQDTVELLGFRSDEEVAGLMDAADFFVNLRYPAMEGWSGSLAQQLALGKPAIVTDSGNAAELPDDVVRKVAPADDDALLAALRELVDDEALRRQTGEAAAALAAERTPERYAADFLAFLEDVRAWKPILDLCDTVVDELATIGADPALRVVEVVAEEVALLVNEKGQDEVELRKLGPDDSDALVRFFVRNNLPEVMTHFHPFQLSPDNARQIARHRGRDAYFGAFEDGEVLGMSMLRGWDEGYEVPSFGVVVDVRHHGRGLGSKLTDFAIEQARELGSERVRLSVYSSNQVAHRMYEVRGFVEQERTEVQLPNGSDERIVMVKELTA